MSVFQLNEWWGVQVSSSEEFDYGCLCIGNVDNSQPPADKIVVGSLEGTVRIYNPTKPQYRIEDLILEEALEFPILQLLIGRSGSQSVNLPYCALLYSTLLCSVLMLFILKTENR